MIVLHAVGETPDPNYKVWLRKAGATDSADFELWWLLPTGGHIALGTPFNVHASFRAGLHPDLVRVRDRDGIHPVEVEPVFVADASGAGSGADTGAGWGDWRVGWEQANQFDLHYHGKDIAYTQANVAGDPILTFGKQCFYGDEIVRLSAPIGELVSVTLEQRGPSERLCMTLVLPRTRVLRYGSATIEALVLEVVVRGSADAPPSGQATLYERANKVTGQATFIFS